jgi:hypothetical protein
MLSKKSNEQGEIKMSKARLHPAVLDLRGAMGDMVFRRRKGKLFASIKSIGTEKDPTQAQVAHRERFDDAVQYGKYAMEIQELRDLYQAAAADTGMSAFNAAVSDFLKPPTVKELNTSAYHGQIGDTIEITTRDEYGVVDVHVKITEDGVDIESGNAVQGAEGRWTYVARTLVTSQVEVIATAKDRPGGVAVKTVNVDLA